MSILSCSPLSVGNNVETNPISPTFSMLIAPLETQLPHLTRLVSRSNRPLEFTFRIKCAPWYIITRKPVPPAKICCKRPTPIPLSTP